MASTEALSIETPATRGAVAIARDLWPHVRGYGLRLFLVVLAGLLAAGLDILTAGLFIPLMQRLIGPGMAAEAVGQGWLAAVAVELQQLGPGLLAVMILALQVVREAGLYGSELLSLSVRRDVDRRLRLLVMRSILDRPYGELEAHGPSTLFTTVNQFTAAGAIVVQTFLLMAVGVVLGLMYVGTMLWVSPILSGVLLVGLMLIALLVNRLVVKQKQLGGDLADYAVRLNRFGYETIHNLPIIFFGNRQSYVASLFERLVDLTVARMWSSGALASLIGPLQRSLAFLVVALAVLAYDLVARAGGVDISGEQLLVIVFMLIRFNGPISQINTLRAQLAVRLPQVEGMLRLLVPATPEAVRTDGRRSAPHGADISFDGVSFAYGDEDRSALAGLSLMIRGGATTALIGPSGSGKSTIVKLLGGLYRPDRGRILVGGIPLDEIDLAQWRGGIAIVSQDYHLFEGTIADNIRFGKLDASEDEIRQASRLANADGFIQSLPRRYDTMIGEGGTGLSGGQKQRIQIARAFIARPKVLILDEATSAQDALSEREVIAAVRALGPSVTVIIISHRLSSLSFADYSYVLDRGRVVEEGEPQSLLSAQGLYYRMSELQLGGGGRAPAAVDPLAEERR